MKPKHPIVCPPHTRLLAAALLPAVIALHSPAVSAQETDASPSATLLEEVVVTARKREESSQDVPVSVTAYDAEQLDALKVRDLNDLSVGIPNVALDEVGTFKGVANFSIRGLGINSSIPSLDPTVGVFVDGVYLGTNTGIALNTHDLASIEVLRGPQGTLFGRNVTGGAILLNSKKPGDSPENSIKTALEWGGDGGWNRYLMGTVDGQLGDNLGARVTAYLNDDDGWFENEFNGDDFGELEQQMVRAGFLWNPTDDSEVYVKFERTSFDGDGPPGQSHLNPASEATSPELGPLLPRIAHHDRDSHDFSIDEHGATDGTVNLFSAQADWQAAGGTFTNIFGWREYDGDSLSDIDSQPLDLFHASGSVDTDQFSNELRFNTLLADDRLNLTMGLYYFTSDLDYAERRNLFTDTPSDYLRRRISVDTPAGPVLRENPAMGIRNPVLDAVRAGVRNSIAMQRMIPVTDVPSATVDMVIRQDIARRCDARMIVQCADREVWDGGGEYEVDTTALFIAGDYQLSDDLALNAGLRYTVEKKEVKIASLIDNRTTYVDRDGRANTPAIILPGQDNRCNVVKGPDCPFDFEDDDTWRTWSPKLGLTLQIDENTLGYTHWARGYRSGGYNLRNTSFQFDPEAFDEERTDNYEIGIKREFERGRLNAAVFYNRIDDLQRELNMQDDLAGVVQIIRNTADADIFGIELEGAYAVTGNFLLLGSVGWLDAEYDKVRFDLDGDGDIDGDDEDLDLPRAADLTYSLGFNWDNEIGGWGIMTARANYAYRDDSAFTDDNRGFINEQRIVNAGLDFHGNNGWTFSLYGKNLLDEVKHGGDTQLPGVVGGGTFSPLAKGRYYGVEASYEF